MRGKRAEVRFVRDCAVDGYDLAAPCLNGRLRRWSIATDFAESRRGNFCERVQQTCGGSALGLGAGLRQCGARVASMGGAFIQDGPQRTLSTPSNAAVQFPQSGSWSAAQHHEISNDGNAEKADFPRVVGIFDQTC